MLLPAGNRRVRSSSSWGKQETIGESGCASDISRSGDKIRFVAMMSVPTRKLKGTAPAWDSTRGALEEGHGLTQYQL